MTTVAWVFVAFTGLFAGAFGAALWEWRQAQDLARSWRDIAIGALGDLTRERHLSEFAVRQLNEDTPDRVYDNVMESWGNPDA